MSMVCKPCAKNFSGIISYNQHIASEKHKRKVSFNLLYNTNNEQQNTIEPVDESPNISCNICNISFESIENFKLHSESLNHVTNVSKKFQNSFDYSNVGIISSSISEDDISHGYVNEKYATLFGDETDVILPPPVFSCTSSAVSFTECKTCNKHFSGYEPYKQHLVSVGHKKRVEMENCISETGSHNMTNIFSCEFCKKFFSGQIPLEQHLVSAIHKKKVQNLQLLQQLKTNKERKSLECHSSMVNTEKSNIGDLTNMEMNYLWFCKICHVQCSGHIPFKQHIEGDTHRKNKRKINCGENITEMKNKRQITIDMVSNNAIDGTVISNPVLLTELNKSNQDIEMDCILPQAMHNILISSDEINIKEFLPDDKINFDKIVENENESPKIKIGKTSMSQEILKEKSETYEKCELCNEILISKENAISHYESLEHFTRRWRSSSISVLE